MAIVPRMPDAPANAVLLVACTMFGAASAQDLSEIDAPALHGAWLVPIDATHAADPPRTTAYLVVLAGERDNDGVPGIAHHAEHLVWQSATRDDHDLGARADANAMTNLLSTTYYLDGPDAELDRTLAILARMLEPIDPPEP